ncbi:uncharacterized protein EDB91DRAFT_325841 [Suillus paluster]|uniref:uncharacterized protein n=1 Tax=Suillus paluster TaxID=48578 RepID=UPI001B87C319|nr:uncharacterized protein EDB91DRAFT_325841 [Suillus paluster]KAG1720628.1 hypothetical protein EDB91DRAFT_325841 [Suillus paluster]
MDKEILDGRKPSALNFSFDPYLLSPNSEIRSPSMETTWEWSKDGGKVEAATKKSTSYSDRYMSTSVLYPSVLQFERLMSPVNTIQQTSHREASTLQPSFYSLQSIFPPQFNNSSSTPSAPTPLLNSSFCATGITPLLPPKSSTEQFSDNKEPNTTGRAEKKKTSSFAKPSATVQSNTRPRFDSPLPNSITPLLCPTTIQTQPHPHAIPSSSSLPSPRPNAPMATTWRKPAPNHLLRQRERHPHLRRTTRPHSRSHGRMLGTLDQRNLRGRSISIPSLLRLSQNPRRKEMSDFAQLTPNLPIELHGFLFGLRTYQLRRRSQSMAPVAWTTLVHKR